MSSAELGNPRTSARRCRTKPRTRTCHRLIAEPTAPPTAPAPGNNCTRRASDEKAASAAETGASQNRTAADRQRANNREHVLHPTFPRRKNYRREPLPLGESLVACWPQCLRPAPGRASSPPEDREDSEQSPPRGIGRLVRDDRENDADHDADQRHEVSDAKGHLLVPLTGKVESEKHDGRDGDAGEQRQQYREEVPDVPQCRHPSAKLGGIRKSRLNLWYSTGGRLSLAAHHALPRNSDKVMVVRGSSSLGWKMS
jgi:hypothetical protein